MKSNILITGGAGFIGSHLCDFFLGKEHRVICVDNLITGSLKNVGHLFRDKNFIFIRHDISEQIRIAGKIEFILHFASPASPPDYLKFPIETLKVGSIGTLNSLRIAKDKRATFLLASTSEVYGDPLEHPQRESYWGNVNCVGSRSVYDEAKRFAESLTMAYHNLHKLDTKIVRIFNTYGERMRHHDGRAIPNFIDQALKGAPVTIYGDGSQTRSFCYITDMVEGIYRLMRSSLHHPVNIGNPHEVSILKLARLIINITKSDSRIIFKRLPADDPKMRRPDITLARRRLKWKPEMPLEEGLVKTIEYFKR